MFDKREEEKRGIELELTSSVHPPTAHEEEMFEDDPIEYIRTDLEPSTGELDRSFSTVQGEAHSVSVSFRRERHATTSRH